MIDISFVFVTKDSDVPDVISSLRNFTEIGVDIETTGLDYRTNSIQTIQIASSSDCIAVFDWQSLSHSSKSIIAEFLRGTPQKVFHNGKFDMKFLKNNGIDIGGNLFDTMLASQVLNAGLNKRKHDLRSTVERYLSIQLDKTEQTSDWSQVLTNTQLHYAALDAYILLPLKKALLAELESTKLLQTAEIEFRALPAIVELELNGFPVNDNMLKRLWQELFYNQEIVRNKIYKVLPKDTKLTSPVQLKAALMNLGVSIPNTQKSTLNAYSGCHPVISKLLEFKQIQKQTSACCKIIKNISPESGRIYSNYFQLAARSGRMSCTKFNLQGVPHDKRFRECFTPKDGRVLVIGDYSQMQLRIAAEITQDEAMLEAYHSEIDLHLLTASTITGKPLDEISSHERQSAKALNFGMLFGMGANGLVDYASNNYGVKMSRSDAKEFIRKFFSKYTGIRRWQRKIHDSPKSSTRTLGGRRRIWSCSEYPKFTQLVNTPIQGTEADIIKTVLGMLPSLLVNTSAKIIAMIHDEIVIECDISESEIIAKILKGAMEAAGTKFLKTVPVVSEVNIAKSWAEK